MGFAKNPNFELKVGLNFSKLINKVTNAIILEQGFMQDFLLTYT